MRHLMLREDVVEAVRAGKFHVHAVATVDEGLALLSGRDAGVRGSDGRFPEDTFNAAVERALEANAARLEGAPRMMRVSTLSRPPSRRAAGTAARRPS